MAQHPAPQDDSHDRRHYFRIDDNVILSYRQVSQEQLPEALKLLQETLANGFTLATVFADISRTTRLLNRQIRLESPALASYFDALERKLDILARILVQREIGVEEEDTQEVNLSAGGIEFQSDEFIPVESVLEIKLMVFPSCTAILAGGRVVRCETAETGAVPPPYTVAVEFIHLREFERQLIIKHMLRKQSIQLRERRQGQSQPPATLGQTGEENDEQRQDN